MIRKVTIVPTLLTADLADYNAQLERINLYSHHVQIDITDGVFAPSQTVGINDANWPSGWEVDLHLMVAEPSKYVDTVISKKPARCIFHAEVKEDLLEVMEHSTQQTYALTQKRVAMRLMQAVLRVLAPLM